MHNTQYAKIHSTTNTPYNKHTVQQIHIRWPQDGQDSYYHTHNPTNNNAHKDLFESSQKKKKLVSSDISDTHSF
jgi:hypothetical protein